LLHIARLLLVHYSSSVRFSARGDERQANLHTQEVNDVIQVPCRHFLPRNAWNVDKQQTGKNDAGPSAVPRHDTRGFLLLSGVYPHTASCAHKKHIRTHRNRTQSLLA
jgi:hypothetical protein